MAGALLLLSGVFAGPALADPDYLLYAGPGGRYPVVAHVAPGVPVVIQGCLRAWDWCDISYGSTRGWIPANNLWGTYQNRRANVIEYGRGSDIPVVVFEQRTYWDNHYRDRPFYHRHIYWNDRHHR